MIDKTQSGQLIKYESIHAPGYMHTRILSKFEYDNIVMIEMEKAIKSCCLNVLVDSVHSCFYLFLKS